MKLVKRIIFLCVLFQYLLIHNIQKSNYLWKTNAYVKKSFIHNKIIFAVVVLKYTHFFLECNNGTFGFGCTNNCSSNCINDLPCNKNTGHCNDGCQPGYTDLFCRKSKKKYYLRYFRTR